MTRPLAVFRADARAATGGGHVYRCLAIAEVLKARGWSCAFVTTPESAELVPRLKQADVEIAAIAANQETELAFMRERWPGGASVVLVDSYDHGRDFESRLKGWANSVSTIDDLTNREHDVDIFIDPVDSMETFSGNRLRSRDCLLLLGPDHAPLREEWRQERSASLARDRGGEVRRIAVTFGAADAANATAATLAALEGVAGDYEVIVILGAGAPHRTEIEKRVAGNPRFRLVSDPPHFARLLASSDIVVGAAGSNSWERCCLGLPSIVVQVADNQRRNVERLVSAGAALSAGALDALDTDLLASLVEKLIRDADLRKTMSRAASNLCDGRGCDRIADAFVRSQ